MQLAIRPYRLISAVLAGGLLGLAGADPVAAQSAELHFAVDLGASEGEAGRCVSGAGDFNNDGYDDVIVGRPSDDTSGTDSGGISVYSGLDGSPLLHMSGVAAGDLAGTSVAGVGDINNNGYDDVIVGAPQSGSGVGYAAVIDFVQGLILPLTDSVPGSRFGFSVSGGGDMNDDGAEDLIVGAPGDDTFGTNSGFFYAYSGVNGSLINAGAGDPGWEYGYAVALRPGFDYDNDLRDDALVSAPGNGIGGVVEVVEIGSTLIILAGDGSGDRYGTSVAVTGDMNGDGKADFLVGAPQVPSNFLGYVRGLDGQTGDTLFTVSGDPFLLKIGGDNRVAGVGDIDGDGSADFVIAATNGIDGIVSVHSGDDGGALFVVSPPVSWNTSVAFGASVSGAGDVNGDGQAVDFVVGAPWAPIFTAGVPGGAAVYIGLPPGTPTFPQPTNALDGRAGGPTLVKLPPGSTLVGNGAGGPGDDLDFEPVVIVPKVNGGSFTSELALPGAGGQHEMNFSDLGEFPTGAAPQQAATADFDGDTKADVLTINKTDDTLTLSKGFGDGTFADPVAFPLTGNPAPVALIVADVNNDTFQDALVGGAAGVTTMLGNGAGSFTLFATTPVSLLTSLAAGKLDAGNTLDVVATSGALATGPGQETGFATVLLGNGSGGFSNNGQFATGKALASVLLGDFDHDLALDALIVAHEFGQVPPGTPPQATVSSYPGNGAGGFGAATYSKGFANAQGIHPTKGALEDINNDTFLDVVYTSSDNISYSPTTFADVQPPLSLLVALNDGAGGFDQNFTLSTAYVGKGVEPLLEDLAPDPFDGNVDIVLVWYVDQFAVTAGGPTGTAFESYVAVLIGDGEGGFTDPAPNQFGTGGAPGDGDIANVNTSAPPVVTGPKLDLVIPNAVSNSLSILLGDGGGGVDQTLTVTGVDDLDPQTLPNGSWRGGPRDARIGDLTNDGKPDIVVYNLWTDSLFGDVRASLSLYVGDGLGGFTKSQYLAVPKAGEFALGDFNEDGKLDVAVIQRYGPAANPVRLRLLAGDGAGHVATSGGANDPPSGLTLTGGLAVADVDGDGDKDLITTARGAGNAGSVVVYRNPAGAGLDDFTKVLSPLFETWTSVQSVTTALVDGDGLRDVLIGTTAGPLYVGAGAANATFFPMLIDWSAVAQAGGALAAGDLNGDLLLDAVSATDATSEQAGVNQLIGDGTGRFDVVPVAGFSTAGQSGALRPLLADMNGDEATDLVLVHGAANTISILVNELNGFSTYGAGKAGTNGIVPSLVGKGYSTPRGLVKLVVSQGLGGAPALMQIGVGKNLTSFLAVQFPLLQLSIGLNGTLNAPGAGGFTLPAFVPDDINLIGAEITFVVLIKDTGSGAAPFKLSATNGLAMLVK